MRFCFALRRFATKASKRHGPSPVVQAVRCKMNHEVATTRDSAPMIMQGNATLSCRFPRVDVVVRTNVFEPSNESTYKQRPKSPIGRNDRDHTTGAASKCQLPRRKKPRLLLTSLSQRGSGRDLQAELCNIHWRRSALKQRARKLRQHRA